MASTAPPLSDRFSAQETAADTRSADGTRASGWTSLAHPEAAAAWDDLANRASEPNPFFESWYLLASLRAIDPGGECRILRHQAGGELAGLVPIIRPRRYYRWPIPHLSSWVHPNCFLGAPLVTSGHETAFWEALLEWADRNAGSALFLHLPEMPLDGALCRALGELCADQRRSCAVVHREERAMLQSADSAQTYFEASLSGKKRKELRRQAARLAELGTVTLTRQLDAEGLAGWSEDFLALEQSGWKGAGGSALGSHNGTATLLREALTGAAQRGRLERLTLSLNGQPIAMLVTFLTPPGAFSYKTAFDERFARYSPGVLLQRENLAVLENPAISWTDSCASADHPMIDHIWRERRAIGRISIAIGGKARRALFRQLLRAELGRNPTGL